MFVETIIPTNKPKRNGNYILTDFERDREFLILLDVNRHSLLKQSFAPVSTELSPCESSLVVSKAKQTRNRKDTRESSFPPRPLFSSLVNGLPDVDLV